MQTALHDVGQARRFLALALPWPDEQISGVFNVVTRALPAQDAVDKRIWWNHIGVRSIDDAVAAINHQILKRNATDIYGWMALGNLATATPFNAKRPDSWFKGNRLAENAVWFKSIFLDIDYGAKKAYKTLPEAQAALDNFLLAGNLPNPNLVVSSGHGFHCHWTLVDPIPADKWQELAGRLIGAVEQHKLSVDVECTLDRARILRVPGTWNNKDPDNPVKVELVRAEPAFLLDALTRALTPYPVSAGPAARAPRAAAAILPPGMTPRAPLAGGPEMMAGVEQTRTPVWIDEVDCPLIIETLATHGRDHANPLWHQLVTMATFCEEGRETAHDLSSGHATYTEEGTDREFDRMVNTRAARPEIGWVSCRKLRDVGGAYICDGCPHLAKDKSPFNFLTFESNPKVEVPPDVLVGLTIGNGDLYLPPGFIKDSSNRVCRIVAGEGEDDPPEQVPITDNQILSGYLTDNPKELHFTYVGIGASQQPFADRARIELRTVPDSRGTRSHLASQGFMVPPEKAKLMEGFLVPWIDELRRAQENKYYDSSSFGWVEHESKLVGFAYDCICWATTPRPAPPPTLTHYRPIGELDVWRRATKLITSQKRPELEILLATAFAAPLVRLLGDTARGIQIFAWSQESGVAKTAAMTIAAAVWGHPVITMNQANDTTNAIDKKMGDLRHLPVLWDEFKTSEDTDAFIMQIFRASGGKGKARLGSDTAYRPVGSWATILACASNAPMLDRIYRSVGRTTAGALRVFEYEIASDKSRMTMADEAKPLLLALESNYGLAGKAYAKWIGEHFEEITEDLHRFRANLEHNLENPAQERFWSATITVLVKGAEYARKLGLVDFDTRAMAAFCIRLVDSMRAAAGKQLEPTKNANDLKDLLTSFRSDLLHYETIRFESIFTGQGNPGNFPYKPYQYNVNNLRVFSVCESDNDDLIRFTAKSLVDWLAERRKRQDNFGFYSANEVIRAMEKLLGATVRPQGKLAPGFSRETPGRKKVIEISTFAHPDLKSHFK